jgi:hypothetical protein
VQQSCTDHIGCKREVPRWDRHVALKADIKTRAASAAE